VKNLIIYITSFLFAFFVVTLGIIYLNANYQNIFEFDFTKIEIEQDSLQLEKNEYALDFQTIKDYFNNEFRKNILDSLKANTIVKYDTVYQEILKDNALLDSINILQSELTRLRTEVANSTAQADKIEVESGQISEEWIKQTAKLFESMDPKNAAKVIKNYSDNEARELIYSMKKNKAAEILTHLDPNFVNRITKSQI